MPRPAAQDVPAPSTPGSRSPGRSVVRSGWARWTGLGVLVFLLGALWAAAMPLMAGPDEPSHVIWGAAVVRGQFAGELGEGAQDASRPGAGTVFELPTDYAAAAALPNCFAFRSEQDAACQQDIAPPVPGEESPVESFAGQYPPLYYALTGWPSLFLAAEAATYGMRLVTAAIVAALVTWGVWRLARTFGAGLATWASAVAVTPMCLFLAGTVNPQALEVSAAFLLWSACAALARGPAPATAGTWVQAAVAWALLVNSRSISVVWAVAIAVVALVMARPGRLRAALRSRVARWCAAGAALATVALGAWLLGHPVLVEGELLHPDLANPLRAAHAALTETWGYLLGVVGWFGWLDAPSPELTWILWAMATGALLLIGLAVRTQRRLTVALVLVVVGLIAAPVVMQIPNAAQTGLIWQGRYGLPVAVGLPVVAVLAFVGQDALVRDVVRRAGRIVVPLLAVGHVMAFLEASRRFAQGTDQRLLALTPEWSSPVGYLTGVALYALVVGTLVLVGWRALRPGPAPVLDDGSERAP